MSEPIVVDTVEKAYRIFGDPGFKPKALMNEGFASWVDDGLMDASGQAFRDAIQGATFDLTKDREALRHWGVVGKRQRQVLRSIDDDWQA